jgi:hypothetical protein
MSSIKFSYAPSVWHFVYIMGHEEPLVFLSIPRLKVGWLVVNRRFFSVKYLEGGESAFWTQSYSSAL